MAKIPAKAEDKKFRVYKFYVSGINITTSWGSYLKRSEIIKFSDYGITEDMYGKYLIADFSSDNNSSAMSMLITLQGLNQGLFLLRPDSVTGASGMVTLMVFD